MASKPEIVSGSMSSDRVFGKLCLMHVLMLF